MTRFALTLALLAAPIAASAQTTVLPRLSTPADCSKTLTTAGTAYSLTIPAARGTVEITNSDTASNGNIYVSATNSNPQAGGAGVLVLLVGGSWTPAGNTTGSYTIYATGTVNGQQLTCTYYP